MRFLIDEQLSRKLLRWFADKAQHAEHVADVLGQAASDHAIAAYARRNGAVIVSKDFDFVDMLEGVEGPRLLWVRTGNLRTGALIERLEAGWPHIEAELTKGRPVVELL